MYLQSLQVNGFKSFARSTKLDFKTNISAIVGPNGSGKSNIAEAFRFALGEQSIKSMRGKKGEDLIFSGRNERLNRAGVKIYLDNRDKTLPLDYEQVKIERVVFRDGVNDYLLNNNKVRAKDIVELLGIANIGSTGHHIIHQGEADKILAVNPKERKMMVEDALGLKPIILKKNESERKLARTDENLKEVKTQQRINAPRLRFLFREVKKSEKVQTQKKELLGLYKLFFPQKKELEKKLKNLNSQIQQIEDQRLKLVNRIEEKKTDLEKIREGTDVQADKDERLQKLNQELQELSVQKSEQQRALARAEYELSLLEEKKSEWEEDKESQQKSEELYNSKTNDILNIIKEFLPSISGEENKSLARRILSYFGINKDSQAQPDFDVKDISRIQGEVGVINGELEKINEREKTISNKIRILQSNQDNSADIFGQEVQIEILQLEKELGGVDSKLNTLINEQRHEQQEWEVYNREEIFAREKFGTEKLQEFFNQPVQSTDSELLANVQRLRILLENNDGEISDELLKEYEYLTENQNFVKQEVADLEKTKGELEKIIAEVGEEIEKKFKAGVEKINSEFTKFFTTLFSGGRAEIFLVELPVKVEEDQEPEFELGLDMKVSLPNKKITGLDMLSGGERSLVSIALLFAMSAINPPPFIILDETDAALDEANSKRYGDMLEKLAEHSQLILITHNRETMSRAGILYGITMDAEGVSRLLSVSLEEAEEIAK